MMHSVCRRCGRESYGFPLCTWCRRKANQGRIVNGQKVVWNNRAKVAELQPLTEASSLQRRSQETPKVSQPKVIVQYPYLAPGLCGALECPRLCARVQHCPAGQRRARRLQAEQARRRFTIKANSQQRRVCDLVNSKGLCPQLCKQCGGCFLPQTYDSQAELKRKAHRPQKVLGAMVSLRESQNKTKEVFQ